MVQLGPGYKPTDHEPTVAFDVLPAGWYAAQITNSEVRKTKDGQSQYLWFEFTLLEQYHPELKGRQLWANINVWNTNPKAVEIANRELSAICHAVGELGELADTEQLHHKPLAIKAKVRPAEGDYEASNSLSGFEPLSKRFQLGAPQGQSTFTPPAPGVGGVKPGEAPPPAWSK